MVVKNVSGFDMMKLYLGSFGTLAVIASANFKLLPAPRAAGSPLCRFDTPAQAFAAADALQQTQLTPTAVEYLNAAALAGLDTGQAAATGPAQCGLLARAEGLLQAVERHLSEMGAIAERSGARAIERLEGAQEAQLWEQVADLPQTAALAPGEAVVKLSVLPGDVEQVVTRVEASAAAADGSALIGARALSGVIYARLRGLDHGHQRALERLKQALAEPKRVVDVFRSLFARDVTTDAHLMSMATGEGIAHLNYLIGRGEATESVDAHGVAWYRATS